MQSVLATDAPSPPPESSPAACSAYAPRRSLSVTLLPMPVRLSCVYGSASDNTPILPHCTVCTTRPLVLCMPCNLHHYKMSAAVGCHAVLCVGIARRNYPCDSTHLFLYPGPPLLSLISMVSLEFCYASSLFIRFYNYFYFSGILSVTHRDFCFSYSLRPYIPF